jgi:hypothetical protein
MQDGPRYLTNEDLNTLLLLNPTNVPANQPATQHDEYGTIGQTEDGRIFRFTKFAGTSSIAAGLLLVAPNAGTNATALAIPTTQPSNTATGNGASGTSALAPGSLSFNVTNGATNVTQDQYQFVEILLAAGGTMKLKLRGHTLAGNAGTITLFLAEPIPPSAVALIAGSDTVNLRYSEWNQPTATLTAGLPVGVTYSLVPQSSTASYAGWIQTRGDAFVQATSATKGQALVQDTAGTAGFFANSAAATTPTIAIAAYTAISNTATVKLMID